jgi:hypothetical protein
VGTLNQQLWRGLQEGSSNFATLIKSVWKARNLSSSQVSAFNHELAILPSVMKVVGTCCLPTLVLTTAFKIGRWDTDEMCFQDLNLSSTKVSAFKHDFWLQNAANSGRTPSNCHCRVHPVKGFV